MSSRWEKTEKHSGEIKRSKPWSEPTEKPLVAETGGVSEPISIHWH